MKKLSFLGPLLLLAGLICHAQVPAFQFLLYVSTSPTGACTNGSPLQIVISTGAIFTCQASTWGEVGVSPDDGFPIVLGTTAIATGSTTTTIAGLTLTVPTFTTPALGTPASGVLTNVTGLPLSTGTTGTLSVARGGTGTGSTLTGLMRGSASAMTAAELSGDCTTSGSNAVVCTKTNGVAFSTSATTDTTNASNIVTGTLPHAQLPTLLSGDIPNNAANTSGTAAGLSGTPALPNGTTATTQSSGDSSTKLANTTFVQNAINGVAISSPTGAATFSTGTGITSAVCAVGYLCNNTRGTLTIVAAVGATTGTIVTVNFSTTLVSAPACFASENGGSTNFGIGNSAPTTSGFNITAGISVSLATLTVNYQCQP